MLPSDDRDILTLAEAARRLGFTVRSARKAVKSGELPAIRLRGRYLVLRRPFERMLERDSDRAAESESSQESVPGKRG